MALIKSSELSPAVENFPVPVFISNITPGSVGQCYSQGELLRALAESHAKEFNEKDLDHWIRMVERFGCSPERIGSRYTVKRDVVSTEFALANIDVRMAWFNENIEAYIQDMIEAMPEIPSDFFHVTCTGYSSPSVPQKLVARKNLPIRVTHLYHMGCYAALPATRLAALKVQSQTGSTLVCHTELSTLHFKPSRNPADWVVQSLFADGCVSYSVAPIRSAARSLRVLRHAEIIIPGTEDQMTWNLTSQAFAMTLGKDVPEIISHFVGPFVEESTRGLDRLDRAIFAIHPGGPKIIDRVQDRLRLGEEQVCFSKQVLFERGNMSSATLPFIWREIVDSSHVPAGAIVVSLAFGPGLTIVGQVAEVVG